MITSSELFDIELDLFLEAVKRRHDFDFTNYARASLERRVRDLMVYSNCDNLVDLLPRVLREDEFLHKIISCLSVQVSEMFRDSFVFKKLRTAVLPLLKTYPQITIWVAGCATGEEAYSLAIMLHEEGMLENSHIFATDIEGKALEKAEEGIFSIDKYQVFETNYRESGGKADFSDYCTSKYEYFKIDQKLKKKISFAQHNLAVDSVFCEANLILCRNVFIYFNKNLQNQVLKLFADSLVRDGFLCLGTKENIAFSSSANVFRSVSHREMMFQKHLKGID